VTVFLQDGIRSLAIGSTGHALFIGMRGSLRVTGSRPKYVASVIQPRGLKTIHPVRYSISTTHFDNSRSGGRSPSEAPES
jgi:hypothetical protein